MIVLIMLELLFWQVGSVAYEPFLASYYIEYDFIAL